MAHIDEQASVIAKHKQQLEETSEAVLDILAARLPPEPDPNLAFTDSALYMQQRVIYDRGIQEIQGVMNAMKEKKARLAEAEQQNDQARARVEAQKVVDAFPHIKGNPQKSEQFWKASFEAGRRIGFTDAELSQISDSRVVIALGKLASYMAREDAAKKAGQGKAAITDKQRPGTIQARKAIGRDAGTPKELRAFRETGSVEAAERALARMEID